MALMVVSGTRTNQLGYLAGAKTDWLAAAASNQSYAAYLAAGFHSEQNSLQHNPIEWTNGSRVRSEPAALVAPMTNRMSR